MTIGQRKLANEGKLLWQEYININGYSFKPTKEGIKKLSRILDLNCKYLEERIYLYLEC